LNPPCVNTYHLNVYLLCFSLLPVEPTTTPTPVVVVEGDIVTFHMTCADSDGKVRPAGCVGIKF
jgi:hypothetical protein